jgi:hypothetical protein
MDKLGGTWATIELAVHGLKVAEVLTPVSAFTNRTVPCADPNEPLIVTEEPATPLIGDKLVMIGTDTVTVKLLLEVAVPPGVVTEIGPVVAEEETVAVICVALLTVKEAAAIPLNLTAVAPVKFVPVMVTLVPLGPLVGVKLVTVGGVPPADPFNATMTMAQLTVLLATVMLPL